MEYVNVRMPKVPTSGLTPDQLKAELKVIKDAYINSGGKKNQKTAAAAWAIIYHEAIQDAIQKYNTSIEDIMDPVVSKGCQVDWVQFIKNILQVQIPHTIPNLLIQKIYYGVPGGGKSHKAKEDTKGYKVFRTTFHPDTEYASLVGSYKPMMNDKGVVRDFIGRQVKDEYNKKIEYSFVPQIFAQAYVEAWKRLIKNEKPEVCLLIEELNRGNCSAIFGDLFQLLDRNKDGFSEYSILADADFGDYIKKELDADFQKYYEIIQGNSDLTDSGTTIPNWDSDPNNAESNKVRLCLPPNLSLVATMNTSDQSLFPMDSAFKRRWDWEYVPIDYNNSCSQFIIKVDGIHKYSWSVFLKKVNEIIYDETKSEDKQMGNFFVKGDSNQEVDINQFISKVMFYLWSEVCKDNPKARKRIYSYLLPNQDSTDKKEEPFKFSDLFGNDRETCLIGFMEKLNVDTIEDSESGPLTDNDKVEYKDTLSKFSQYCSNQLDDILELPNPRWNEMWIPKIKTLSDCSLKIAINKTGFYIGFYPKDFNKVLLDRKVISEEFNIPNNEISGFSSSGWNLKNNYIKIQNVKGESSTQQDEFDWVIKTIKHLNEYFSSK